MAFGLDGRVVDIIVLDSNAKRMKPKPQEAMEEVENILGHPPKLYISLYHPGWRLREHYHYIGESTPALFFQFNADRFFQMIECPIFAVFHFCSVSELSVLLNVSEMSTCSLLYSLLSQCG
jgi:hypothetical protein